MINLHNDKVLNIAIVGLGLSKLCDLKAHISSIVPFDYSVNWVAVNEQRIDLLMIDDYFYDSPNLQKIIAQSRSNVLKLKTCNESAGIIEDQTLFLPLNSSTVLQHWFNRHVLGNSANAAIPSHASLADLSADKQQAVDLRSSAIPQATNFKETSLKDGLLKEALKLEFFQELINPQHGKIFIYDANGKLAIADTRKEMVWTFADEMTATDSSLNYMHAKASEVDDIHLRQAKDLRQWLWQLVWQSASYHSLVNLDDNLKLDFWPQPAACEQRREILKIAACFQKGANIHQVATHLNIPVRQVQGFASACLAAGLGHKIGATDTGFRFNAQEPTAEVSTLRSFFGKLRKHFGL